MTDTPLHDKIRTALANADGYTPGMLNQSKDNRMSERSVEFLTVGNLREQLAEIDGDVKINIVIGDFDDDFYSGWNGELFSWNEGEDHVILFGHVEDNTEASVREAYPENFL